MNRVVTIADVTICLTSESEMSDSDGFASFLSEKQPSCQAEFRCGEYSIENIEKIIHSDLNFDVCCTSNGTLIRRFYDPMREDALYAWSVFQERDQKVTIWYRAGYEHNLNHMKGAFFHIQFEKLMLEQSRIIFHASCIDTCHGGILFSGPSGIGKSTQADLWQRQENAVLLNGDRPILGLDDGVWTAYGSPYAGSSKCYKNEKTSVRAIVMLKQGTDNGIRKLTGPEAFHRLLEQVTLNMWDTDYMMKACDLVEKMIEKAPIYELEATPDFRAVDALKEKLLREEETWIMK